MYTVSVSLANVPITVSNLWAVQLYDWLNVSKMATPVNVNADGSIVHPTTDQIILATDDTFVYPLHMVLIYQYENLDVEFIRQSLGPGFGAYGVYDNALIIPSPGTYLLDYDTYALTYVSASGTIIESGWSDMMMNMMFIAMMVGVMAPLLIED